MRTASEAEINAAMLDEIESRQASGFSGFRSTAEVFDDEPPVSAREARREIGKHDCEDGWAGFVAEYGQRDWSNGADVLGYLGY